MARIQKKRLKVDPATGVSTWEWFQRAAAPEVEAWLVEIDAGNVAPFDISAEPVIELPDLEGNFDFAVVQMDANGNRSDPETFETWVNAPLDTTPPDAATGGVLEDVPQD